MSEIKQKIKVLFLFCTVLLCLTISKAYPAWAADSQEQSDKARQTVKADCGTWIIKGTSTYFRGTDKKLVKNKWKKIDHKLYYFNAKGVMLTGWLSYNNRTYYLNKDGHMQTGWLLQNSRKFYFSSKGILQRGFLHIGSKWYYANTKSGRIKTGWLKINGKTYYFKKSGVMKTGWATLNGKRYYFYRSGIMATGTISINNKSYVFRADGTLNKSASASDINPDKKMVALTFDDGPGRYTMTLLDALQKYNAKATFFLVGENVAYYNLTVKRMSTMGCEIGNHTMNHARLTALSASQIYAQISETNDRIRAVTGHNATVMRPPYGSYNNAVLNAVGLPAIFWSIDTMDWSTLNTYSTVAHVKQNVRDGSIILMHDIYSTSVDAAVQLIPWLQEQGYQLVTVSEMARYRIGGLHSGSIYSHMYP